MRRVAFVGWDVAEASLGIESLGWFRSSCLHFLFQKCIVEVLEMQQYFFSKIVFRKLDVILNEMVGRNDETVERNG